MEGVGARLGRSSTRYGPTTVFTGPVRKWKKKWVHITPPSSNNNINHHHHQAAANGTVNGSNGGAHLLLYKWTPLTASQNQENDNGNTANGDNAKSADDKDDGGAVLEPPKRKFKYIPVALLEEQKNEESEQAEDEAKPIEIDTKTREQNSKGDGFDEKPDINDVPMEENQDAEEMNHEQRQDLNESTLDLSLGLNRDNNSDSKTDLIKDAPSEAAGF